ncbi:MAG: hypothetical protein ABJG68_02265 [Crocinitomicaceae bacterium]
MLIRLKHIPKYTTTKEMKKLFSTYGVVKNIVRCPNVSFIKMKCSKRGQIALNNLHGMKWKGNFISVRKIKSSTTSPICRTPIGAFRLI